MSQKINGEDYLVEHYAALGDLKSDFRNYNLFNFLAEIVTGNNVVDVGCGAAYLLNILKSRGKSVMGIEPSSGMRDLARQINPGISVLAGMAEDVDTLVKEKVGTILMIDVLEHVEKDFEQVEKVKSVLKPSGEFIFVVPAHQILFGKRDKEMGHYRRYSKAMLQKIFDDNGLHVEYMRHWNAMGFIPYLISEKIFQRPLESKLRRSTKPRSLSALIQKALNMWFKTVENNFDFHFGLSIIGIARVKS